MDADEHRYQRIRNFGGFTCKVNPAPRLSSASICVHLRFRFLQPLKFGSPICPGSARASRADCGAPPQTCTFSSHLTVGTVDAETIGGAPTGTREGACAPHEPQGRARSDAPYPTEVQGFQAGSLASGNSPHDVWNIRVKLKRRKGAHLRDSRMASHSWAKCFCNSGGRVEGTGGNSPVARRRRKAARSGSGAGSFSSWASADSAPGSRSCGWAWPKPAWAQAMDNCWIACANCGGFQFRTHGFPLRRRDLACVQQIVLKHAAAEEAQPRQRLLRRVAQPPRGERQRGGQGFVTFHSRASLELREQFAEVSADFLRREPLQVRPDQFDGERMVREQIEQRIEPLAGELRSAGCRTCCIAGCPTRLRPG